MASRTLGSHTAAIAVLLAMSLTAWIALAGRMSGMDAGPGTDLGGFVWFVGVWVTMSAAMMLPSSAPAVALVAQVYRCRSAAAFTVGYLAAWAAYGLAAYAVYRVLHSVAPSLVAWDRSGPVIAGAALALAGTYQLTPLKRSCLRRCLSPLALFRRDMDRTRAAARAGLAYGGVCIGCCIGLMLALFTLGVMSLFWMAVVTAAIAAEKLLPRAERSSTVLAMLLVALGVWVAAAPAGVPGLTQPGQALSMEMTR